MMPIGLAAQEHDPEEVLAYQGDTVLTQDAIDAAFDKVPAEGRLMFIRDREKVSFVINSLLLNKKLSAEAYRDELDKDPLVRERLKLAAEEELAVIWREHLMSRAPEADYEAMAYEIYLSDPSAFKTAEKVDVSHILIGLENRGEDEAARIAADLVLQLSDEPEKFDELVAAHSEDPGKNSNKGRFPSVGRGQMVKPFEKAAFAMSEPGEISDPVRSKFGYHIIRFNGRQESVQEPFEQVKSRLVEKVKKDHQSRYRDAYMAELVKDPVEFPEGALEVMVNRQFGEDLERAPVLPEFGK